MKRFGVAVMIATLAGGVNAAEPNSDDANLLRGPKVVDNSGPDGGNTMNGERSGARPTGDLPLRAYLGAVRGLHKAAKDNPELALTDEQKDQIKAIGQAHKEKMEAFMEEHKAELAEMRGQQGERGERKAKGNRKQGDAQNSDHGPRGGKKGKAGDKERVRGQAGDRPSPEQRQRMREKMGELMSKAPSDQDAKKQLWAVLTAEQQAAVKENIAEMREKRQERIDGAMERRRKGKEGKKGKERKGEPQGMIENPIFEIDEVIEISDDC